MGVGCFPLKSRRTSRTAPQSDDRLFAPRLCYPRVPRRLGAEIGYPTSYEPVLYPLPFSPKSDLLQKGAAEFRLYNDVVSVHDEIGITSTAMMTATQGFSHPRSINAALLYNL